MTTISISERRKPHFTTATGDIAAAVQINDKLRADADVVRADRTESFVDSRRLLIDDDIASGFVCGDLMKTREIVLGIYVKGLVAYESFVGSLIPSLRKMNHFADVWSQRVT